MTLGGLAKSKVTFNHWVTGSNPVPLTIYQRQCDGHVTNPVPFFVCLMYRKCVFYLRREKASDFSIVNRENQTKRLINIGRFLLPKI